jgi:hypothetical protein
MFSNGPKIVTTGLSLLADASDQLSYPGSGTAWTDIITGTTASLSGSISFTTDFQGSLVTANSSSVIIFPSSTANFGTQTFTVEFAFRPSQINGQHWILSKNSGSFPNWGVFVTGSSGSGRLVAFFNISSTVSCSLVSPTASIITGSNYIVDVGFNPSTAASRLYINSEVAATGSANGTGTLSATSPLFFSNINSGSNSGTVNSIFNIKTYTPRLTPGLIRQNYNTLSTRLGLPAKIWLASTPDSLLDTYPGAISAYSLRSLSADYSGYAIRVRRSSDNAEQDIGFSPNGNLDTSTLLFFCGGGNGFVTVWYDQTGSGRNATNSTAALQPQIVENGVVSNNGVNLGIKWDSGKYLNSIVPYTIQNVFWVAKSSSPSGFQTILNTATSLGISPYYAASAIRGSNNVYNNPGDGSDLINPGGLMYYNGNLNTSLDPMTNRHLGFVKAGTTKTSAGGTQIGVHYSSDRAWIGHITEIIIYPTDQTSNRTAIESNINSYYNIY